MASMVKMTREDELVYVFSNEVLPAFESDNQARQGKIYCAAVGIKRTGKQVWI